MPFFFLSFFLFFLPSFLSFFLTDYKAILSKGKLCCAGTSLFLKNRFGIGYHLKWVCLPPFLCIILSVYPLTIPYTHYSAEQTNTASHYYCHNGWVTSFQVFDVFLWNKMTFSGCFSMALSDDCDRNMLTQMVQEQIHGAQVIRQHGKEMAFSLPMQEVTNFSGNRCKITYRKIPKT